MPAFFFYVVLFIIFGAVYLYINRESQKHINKVQQADRFLDSAKDVAKTQRLGDYLMDPNILTGRVEPTEPMLVYERGLLISRTHDKKEWTQAYFWRDVEFYYYNMDLSVKIESAHIDGSWEHDSSTALGAAIYNRSFIYTLRLEFPGEKPLILKYSAPNLDYRFVRDRNWKFQPRYEFKSVFLLNKICEQIAKAQVPPLIERLDKGETIRWGIIDISSEGLTVRDELITWMSINAFYYETDSRVIDETTKKHWYFVQISLNDIPDVRYRKSVKLSTEECPNFETINQLVLHYGDPEYK